MSRIGIGVVGVGEMGYRHAENIALLREVASLVAVADATPGRAEKVADKLGAAHAFDSIDALLECKDVQAVVLVTPDKFHAEGIIQAAEAGKDILCEKPIALSPEDARRAIAAVENAGVRLQIGFMRRYDPAYKRAQELISAGEIGEPVLFKSLGRDKDAPPLGYYKAALCGMMFYNASIHDFDLCRWLVSDEIAEVHAATTVAIRPELAEYGDIVAGLVNLRYTHGAIGNIECYVQSGYGYDVRTEIVGSKGTIHVGTLAQAPIVTLTAAGASAPVADSFLARFADAYRIEMADFIDMLSSDRAPAVTALDGLRALEIAVAAEQSHLSSAPVKVIAS